MRVITITIDEPKLEENDFFGQYDEHCIEYGQVYHRETDGPVEEPWTELSECNHRITIKEVK